MKDGDLGVHECWIEIGIEHKNSIKNMHYYIQFEKQ